jgi:hypothetical protein
MAEYWRIKGVPGAVSATGFGVEESSIDSETCADYNKLWGGATPGRHFLRTMLATAARM